MIYRGLSALQRLAATVSTSVHSIVNKGSQCVVRTSRVLEYVIMTTMYHSAFVEKEPGNHYTWSWRAGRTSMVGRDGDLRPRVCTAPGASTAWTPEIWHHARMDRCVLELARQQGRGRRRHSTPKLGSAPGWKEVSSSRRGNRGDDGVDAGARAARGVVAALIS